MDNSLRLHLTNFNGSENTMIYNETVEHMFAKLPLNILCNVTLNLQNLPGLVAWSIGYERYCRLRSN